MYNKIEYGDGDIKIDIGNSVIGFEIVFSGTYKLESYNPHNFYISYNKGKIIGVGMGNTLAETPFLKYKGDLKVNSCKVVTTDMEIINLMPKLIRNDKFNYVRNAFDGENLKFENLDNVGIVGKIPNKTTVRIITKNLTARFGQLTLRGASYVGDYHLHHTGLAMTGADYTEDSEILTIKNKIKSIRDEISKISYLKKKLTETKGESDSNGDAKIGTVGDATFQGTGRGY